MKAAGNDSWKVGLQWNPKCTHRQKPWDSRRCERSSRLALRNLLICQYNALLRRD